MEGLHETRQIGLEVERLMDSCCLKLIVCLCCGLLSTYLLRTLCTPLCETCFRSWLFCFSQLGQNYLFSKQKSHYFTNFENYFQLVKTKEDFWSEEGLWDLGTSIPCLVTSTIKMLNHNQTAVSCVDYCQLYGLLSAVWTTVSCMDYCQLHGLLSAA